MADPDICQEEDDSHIYDTFLQPADVTLQHALHLEYPQLVLNASISSLLNHSAILATNASVSMASHDSESSLGESWASLSTLDVPSEDELRSETTDTGSLLIDLPNTDDDQSIHGEVVNAQAVAAAVSDLELDLADSEKTTDIPLVLDMGEDSPSVETLKLETLVFEEPRHWPKDGCAYLSLPIDCHFRFADEVMGGVPALGGRNTMPMGTVRMAIAQEVLSTDQPFKILFHGTNTGSRGQILRKVADALVAATDFTAAPRAMNSSRYHVLPMDFGPGSSSTQAEMIPIHTQIIVEDTVSTTRLEKTIGAPYTITTTKGEIDHSCRDGRWSTGPERSPWTLPNLAIFAVHSDYFERHTQEAVRISVFMRQHAVPSLFVQISDDPCYVGELFETDPYLLHRSIDRKFSPKDQEVVSLPIDLDTFLNINSTQLNRHLAVLSKLTSTDQECGRKRGLRFASMKLSPPTNIGDVEKNLSKSMLVRPRAGTFLDNVSAFKEKAAIALAWIGILVIGFSISHILDWPSRTVQQTEMTSTQSVAATTIPVATSSAAQLALVSPTLRRDTYDHVLPALRGQTDLAQLRANPLLQARNDSDKILVEIVGDCHIVVKTPQPTWGRRRKSALSVHVFRGHEKIVSNTSKLFDGVYVVKILREDARGKLNATIFIAESKSSQTFEVDFGRNDQSHSLWQSIGLDAVLDRLYSIPPAIQKHLQHHGFPTRLRTSPTTALVNRRFPTKEMVYESLRRFSFESSRRLQLIRQELIWSVRNEIHWAKKTWVRGLQKGWRQHTSRASSVGRNAHAAAITAAAIEYDRLRITMNNFAALDLSAIRPKWEDLSHSELLSTAQERAFKIVKDAHKKLKEYHAELKQRRRGRRSTRGSVFTRRGR